MKKIDWIEDWYEEEDDDLELPFDDFKEGDKIKITHRVDRRLGSTGGVDHHGVVTIRSIAHKGVFVLTINNWFNRKYIKNN